MRFRGARRSVGETLGSRGMPTRVSVRRARGGGGRSMANMGMPSNLSCCRCD